MNKRTATTITTLTDKSVCLMSTTFIKIDDVEQQWGEVSARSYMNTPRQRAELLEKEDEKTINAVMAIFGDTPTMTDPEPRGLSPELTDSEVEQKSQVEPEP